MIRPVLCAFCLITPAPAALGHEPNSIIVGGLNSESIEWAPHAAGEARLEIRTGQIVWFKLPEHGEVEVYDYDTTKWYPTDRGTRDSEPAARAYLGNDCEDNGTQFLLRFLPDGPNPVTYISVTKLVPEGCVAEE